MVVAAEVVLVMIPKVVVEVPGVVLVAMVEPMETTMGMVVEDLFVVTVGMLMVVRGICITESIHQVGIGVILPLLEMGVLEGKEDIVQEAMNKVKEALVAAGAEVVVVVVHMHRIETQVLVEKVDGRFEHLYLRLHGTEVTIQAT